MLATGFFIKLTKAIFSRKRVKGKEHKWLDLQLVFHQAKQIKEMCPTDSRVFSRA